MEEKIKEIAKENISNRRKGSIALIISILLFCVFFAISIETNFELIATIIGFIICPIIGILISKFYSDKVIGQKTQLDYEVERLKELYPEEKLELPKIDEVELKLKEMIRRSNRDDMV